jgi:hypothetical protein
MELSDRYYDPVQMHIAECACSGQRVNGVVLLAAT